MTIFINFFATLINSIRVFLILNKSLKIVAPLIFELKLNN